MDTTVGQSLAKSRWRVGAALVVATAVVAADFFFANAYRVAYEASEADYKRYMAAEREFMEGNHFDIRRFRKVERAHEVLQNSSHAASQASDALNEVRAFLSLTGLLALVALSRGDRAALGLVAAPAQGWKYWGRVGAVACLLTWAVALPLAAVWLYLGWEIHTAWDGESNFHMAFMDSVIRAPIFEEVIYRLVLCAPLAAWLGMRGTVLIGGLLFSLIHVVGGNPNPVNLVAGFFFVWVFLKSGTVLIPMLIHLLGNAFFLYTQLFLTSGQAPPVP